MSRIAVVTFIVGADYKRAMEPGMRSKRNWCGVHKYTFFEGGERFWDRTRPIPWSKLLFIQSIINDFDKHRCEYLFVSDADVLITNPEIALADVLTIPPLKLLTWTQDACGNLNSGHMFLDLRTETSRAWLTQFFELVWAQTDILYHIWWENAAMIRVLRELRPDWMTQFVSILTGANATAINAFVFDREGSALVSETQWGPLWRPGALLIHFAGVYDMWNIHRMMKYIDGNVSIDFKLLSQWRGEVVIPMRSK